MQAIGSDRSIGVRPLILPMKIYHFDIYQKDLLEFTSAFFLRDSSQASLAGSIYQNDVLRQTRNVKVTKCGALEETMKEANMS